MRIWITIFRKDGEWIVKNLNLQFDITVTFKMQINVLNSFLILNLKGLQEWKKF